MDIKLLKNLLSEASCASTNNNNNNINLEKWGSRGKKSIQIPSVGHLKNDRFNQNIKQDNFIDQKAESRTSRIIVRDVKVYNLWDAYYVKRIMV